MKLGDVLDDINRFVRASFLGYSWMLILLGAGSVDPSISWPVMSVLLGIGFNYHLFGYLHNDLIDLPVDRTQPLRAQDPLVRGVVKERHAWILALLQIPISLVLASTLEPGLTTYVVLILGYITTVIYNVYGKKCPVPILTDAIQGVAWFCLAATGATLLGEFSALSWVIAGFGFAFIFLINGVHGGLRDLSNDVAHGRVTTASYLGATAKADGTIVSTRKVQIFAGLAFLLVLVPSGYALFAGWLPYEGLQWIIVSVTWVFISIVSTWTLCQVVRKENADRVNHISAHQLPLLIAPIALFLPGVGWNLQITLLLGFFVPIFVFVKRVRNLRSFLFRRESLR